MLKEHDILWFKYMKYSFEVCLYFKKKKIFLKDISRRQKEGREKKAELSKWDAMNWESSTDICTYYVEDS